MGQSLCAQELYNRAQRTKSDTAAGSDAWKPVELKALPQAAWEARATIFQLSSELARYPSSYYEVTTVALPKKDKGTQPLDHRLLAIFSSLYRIEAGARFDIIKPWLRTILYPAVMGAIEGIEALDIAWDAQAFIERAMLNNEAMALVSYDFKKFFDSFEHSFTRDMLKHAGSAKYAFGGSLSS